MKRIPNSEAVPRLKAILAAEGIRAAVIYLNSLSAFRFTSLYRFEGEVARDIFFFDRESPGMEDAPDVLLMATYCVFLRETRDDLTIHDSLCDERVRDHPKREKVRSYCGVPLVNGDGKVFGSVCHFDFKPVLIADADVELLERMGALVQHRL